MLAELIVEHEKPTKKTQFVFIIRKQLVEKYVTKKTESIVLGLDSR